VKVDWHRNLAAIAAALILGLLAFHGAHAQSGLVLETEPVAGSRFPVTYHLIMTPDGLYTPIGLRKPAGDGPFPVVLFASGNGGEGLEYVRDYSHNRSWTLDQFLDAGYAVAWLRYRAEFDRPRYDGTALAARPGSGRAVFNRAPYEYEDVVATIDYVQTLPFIDAERVGYMGMSHGGEMLMKMASCCDGIAAGIASEPASAGFLARRPADPNAPQRPETATAHDETALAKDVEQLRGRIDHAVAMSRIAPIDIPIFVQGRDRDHNQDVFRLNYELLVEAGKDVQWKTYDHELHGFAYVARNDDGSYTPDEIQRAAVADAIAFFDAHLK
jgi:dienelactone hydrolase